jgi:hypothetical protein
LARRSGEVVRTARRPAAILRGRYLQIAANAYLALLSGDSAGAERHFAAISDSLCLIGSCFIEKLAEARLLAARGKERQAAEILTEWEQLGGNGAFAVMSALERGRIAERLGDQNTAVNRYQFVVDAWRRADPELQRFVEEARAGLRRYRR